MTSIRRTLIVGLMAGVLAIALLASAANAWRRHGFIDEEDRAAPAAVFQRIGLKND